MSLIGIYTFLIRSEIEVPDDYTMSTTTIMTAEEEITVTVNPCQVSTYTDTQKIVSITYNIGAPDLTDGSYEFTESPICEYPETITVTNLPPWAIHNDFSKDFTIPSTSDLSLIGSYSVTLRGEIEVPDDATLTTYSPMFVEYDFTIFIEPCIVNTYSDTLKVTLIEYFIGDPTLVDGNYMFKQDPFCGYDETVTVSNVPAFAVHNDVSADFGVPTNSDLSLIGEYIITIRSEI